MDREELLDLGRAAMLAALEDREREQRLNRMADALAHAHLMNEFAEVQAEHEAHSRRTLGKYGHAFGM